jgi:hypothetical protein
VLGRVRTFSLGEEIVIKAGFAYEDDREIEPVSLGQRF